MDINIEVFDCEKISRRADGGKNGAWDGRFRNFSKWKDSMKSDTAMEQMAGDFVVIKP